MCSSFLTVSKYQTRTNRSLRWHGGRVRGHRSTENCSTSPRKIDLSTGGHPHVPVVVDVQVHLVRSERHRRGNASGCLSGSTTDGRSKTRALTRAKHSISRVEPLQLPFHVTFPDDRITPRPYCFHLAQRDRAIAVIFEFPSLTTRCGGAILNPSREATRDPPREGELCEGCEIDLMDQHADTNGDLSQENARHECGTLWCVRGTVVRTLNSVGTPHPHSGAVRRSCATVCGYVHVHPHNHATRGRVEARGGTVELVGT